ncbi:MAG: TonB-dependent receptor [Pyrinomonadaceae bacterium]
MASRASSLVGAGGRERTIGVFAQDAIRATDDLILTVGARYDRWRNYDALSVARPLSQPPPAVTIFPDRPESAVSPRASLLYKASDRFLERLSLPRFSRAHIKRAVPIFPRR